ncbi:hypothetical protein HAX54_046614, partial [Datura stramonium]|nr:hypothetical protein [Datura stramonium]
MSMTKDLVVFGRDEGEKRREVASGARRWFSATVTNRGRYASGIGECRWFRLKVVVCG